jgi:hypothetical protein
MYHISMLAGPTDLGWHIVGSRLSWWAHGWSTKINRN